MCRLILILESIVGALPTQIGSWHERRRFSDSLADSLPITVVEYDIDGGDELLIAHAVARLLRRNRYYAHIVADNEQTIYVIYPYCVVELHRGDDVALTTARTIGSELGIPATEMQFDVMFDVDHPDLRAQE